jgi:hypothetical protein
MNNSIGPDLQYVPFALARGAASHSGGSFMKESIFVGTLLFLVTLLQAPSIQLPPRSSTAPGGEEFARSIAELSLQQREERILAAVLAGNVPPFLRTFVPVSVEDGTDRVTFFVAPDYLATGSDEDFFLTPLTPYTAQKIADELGCALPTPRMVDEIYRAATVKRMPSPIPPSPAMTTVPVFLRHNEAVLAQRQVVPRGALVAGHKKDVVIARKLLESTGKVAIYGWHRPDGRPIQPLYTGHAASWVDYSHGIRLVQRRMIVNGEPETIDQVLSDPRLAALLSDEGVLRRTRYEFSAFPTEARPARSLAAPGEVADELWLDDGVRVMINRPEARSPKPVLLVFYALPNGNTIEQTVGKSIRPGDDWHFDIQHIGAQTRFLRETIPDRSVVVAYLENDLLSWPSWRGAHGDDGFPAIIDAVRKRFDASSTRIVLNAHSGGGSLIFGYMNAVEVIPDSIERIAFLDSNYAYETDRHRDKLVTWLKASDRHYLVIEAYNDAAALLKGKPFVSQSEGTWGRSRLMLSDLEGSLPFTRNRCGELKRIAALRGRVTFLLRENPEREILHTVQVERNGFIESLLAGTPLEGVGYMYLGHRAYERFIRPD